MHGESQHPATPRKKLRVLKMRALHLQQDVRLASNHAQVSVSLSGEIRQSRRTETSVVSVIHQR